MYSVAMHVTPEMAGGWLKKNHPGNRKIQKSRVDYYKRLIENKEFLLDPFGIVFDTNGNLINGQHRLTAIAETGATVDMYVTFDAPEETIKILDTQQTRTFQQRRYMAGKDNSKIEISMAKFLCYYFFKKETLIEDLVNNFLDVYGDSILAMKKIAEHGAKHGLCCRAPVVAGIWCAYMFGIEERVLREFCKIANSGFYDNESQTSAIVFRKQLTEYAHIKNRADQFAEFCITQEAIDAFAKQKSRRVKWTAAKPLFFNEIKEVITI